MGLFLQSYLERISTTSCGSLVSASCRICISSLPMKCRKSNFSCLASGTKAHDETKNALDNSFGMCSKYFHPYNNMHGIACQCKPVKSCLRQGNFYCVPREHFSKNSSQKPVKQSAKTPFPAPLYISALGDNIFALIFFCSRSDEFMKALIVSFIKSARLRLIGKSLLVPSIGAS